MREEMAYESQENRFCSIDGFHFSYKFRQCIDRYNGNYKIKSYSCRDQFLCIAFFAKLTYLEFCGI